MSMKSVGYLVITIPEQFRNDFYNKKLLSDFRRYIIRKLKDDGFNKGLSRWHWAGDCTTCKGKGCKKCNKTGSSDVWSPHLNILIENGYEPFVVDTNNWINRYKEDIALHMCSLIRKYRKILKAEKYAKDLDCEFDDINLKEVELDHYELQKVNSIVIHYSYSDKPARKIHWNKYINRATWRYEDKSREISTIKGYRTTQRWGKWNIKTHERKSELVALEKGVCPECSKEKIKSKLQWGRFQSKRDADFDYKSVKREISAGYFLLDLPPPDPEVDFSELHDIVKQQKTETKVFKGDYAGDLFSNN